MCLFFNAVFPILGSQRLAPPSVNFTASNPKRAKIGYSHDNAVNSLGTLRRARSEINLSADFMRMKRNMHEKLESLGFISSNEDPAAKGIYKIYMKLLGAYNKLSIAKPGFLRIVDSNEVRAHVMHTENDVYFYKGLYETLHDTSAAYSKPLYEDIIAYILAHELAHVYIRASKPPLSKEQMYNRYYAPDTFMQKKTELDTDILALDILDMAGYSVNGSLGFFELIELTRYYGSFGILQIDTFKKQNFIKAIEEGGKERYSNIGAARKIFEGNGRMKSRDVDFRFFLKKSGEEIIALARAADSIVKLDELLGMFMKRKLMDVIKALIYDEDVKLAFLIDMYMQSAWALLFGESGHRMPGTVNYGNMRFAASVCDVGVPAYKEKFLEKRERFTTDVLESRMRRFKEVMLTSQGDESYEYRDKFFQKAIFEILAGNCRNMSAADYNNFLLPFEDVSELIPLFKNDKKAVKLSEIAPAMYNPAKLISAYLYANHIGKQTPPESKSLSSISNMRLPNIGNFLYQQDPAYRAVMRQSDRDQMQNILLIHYSIRKPETTIFPQSNFKSFSKHLNVSRHDVYCFFLSYYLLLSKEYPMPVACHIAFKKLSKYFGRSERLIYIINELHSDISSGGLSNLMPEIFFETLKKANKNELKDVVSSHPLIRFIDSCISKNHENIPNSQVFNYRKGIKSLQSGDFSDSSFLNSMLELISGIYYTEQFRPADVPKLFEFETGLAFPIGSALFGELSSMPDWAISDYLNSRNKQAVMLFASMLKDGQSVADVLSFMQHRLGYTDRREFFEAVFLSDIFGKKEKNEYLANYFSKTFSNDPVKIINFFTRNFTEVDAPHLLMKFCVQHYCGGKEAIQAVLADESKKKLSKELLEYLFSQTSEYFIADKRLSKLYLDLIDDEVAVSGRSDDAEYVKNKVFGTLMVLSGAVDLNLGVSDSESIKPKFKFFKNISTSSCESKCSLHNFGWNESRPGSQSIFVKYIVELSAEQIKQLLAQRRKYEKYISSRDSKAAITANFEASEFYPDLLTLILLDKINPNSKKAGDVLDPVSRLDNYIAIKVNLTRTWVQVDRINNRAKFNQVKAEKPTLTLKYTNDRIDDIPFELMKEQLLESAVPSSNLGRMWEEYMSKRGLSVDSPYRDVLFKYKNIQSWGAELILGSQ